MDPACPIALRTGDRIGGSADEIAEALTDFKWA
jgi:hypothetical protein